MSASYSSMQVKLENIPYRQWNEKCLKRMVKFGSGKTVEDIHIHTTKGETIGYGIEQYKERIEKKKKKIRSETIANNEKTLIWKYIITFSHTTYQTVFT